MSKRLEIINFQRGMLATIKAEVDSITDGCEELASMLDEGKLLRLHADSEDEESGKVFAESETRRESSEELTQALLNVCALKRDPRVRLQAAASLLAIVVSTVHDDPSIVSLLGIYSLADALNYLGTASAPPDDEDEDDAEQDDRDWDGDDSSLESHTIALAEEDPEDQDADLPPAESKDDAIIKEYNELQDDET